MKKLIVLLIFISMLILSSCSGGESAEEVKKTLQNKHIERITITNSGYAGKYTIKDQKSMERFLKYLEKAKVAKENPNLTPDFIFEIYGGENNIATYNYIAGITDSDEANLIDKDGKLYKISRNVEDIFLKRIMKKNKLEHVPEYYVALITKIVEKQNIKEGSKIVADIGSDLSVTKSITAVEQRSILNSINKDNIKVMFPDENKAADYKIVIKTSKYDSTSCEAKVTVTDKKNKATRYEVSGNYKGGSWEFHIKFS